MNSAKIVFVLLLLAGMFLPSRVVRADIAPPPAPQLGGLEPFEYQDTNVQMVYERVEMEIQSFVPSEDETFAQSRVNTTAYFSMRNQGDTSESMQAIFPLESDKLYVPVSSLHLISRYSGAAPEQAPLHQLGGGEWDKAKKKAAAQVRDTAAELLALYAVRAAREGYAFTL